jgi:hypothetical protein
MSRPRINGATLSGATLAGASRPVAAAVLLGVLLGGCSDIYFERRETIALGAGDAVAANQVEQMVDPWPPYSNNKNLTFSGERMQRAIECYRVDKVTQPVDLDPSTDSNAPPPPPGAACAGRMSSGSAQPAAGTAIGSTAAAAVGTGAYK